MTTPNQSATETQSSTQTVQASGLRAEIVTTGTEILLGEIVDTNAAWIAQQLRDAGVNLYYKSTVGDNLARIRGVIELGLSRSDVLIVSGGLGPTADDVTRHAIAEATRRPLVMNEAALAAIQARFARFGSQMTENNKQQALIPEGAIMIENPVGTAPGFIVETDEGRAVIAVPGVPREMKHLMTETVLPYLRQRSGNMGIIRRRVFRTIGIGESMIDTRLSDLMNNANPTVGLAAHTAQADVRITARAATSEEADAMLDEIEAVIRERIGQFIYSSTPGEPYEAVVARALRGHQATVALLETNTQGAIARRLAGTVAEECPVIAQWTSAEAPPTIAELVESAASPEQYGEALAVQCAQAVLRESGATYALVALGTGGKDEGVFGRTSGQTWLALAGPDETKAALCPYGGTDEYTVVRIGNQALGLLWAKLTAS